MGVEGSVPTQAGHDGASAPRRRPRTFQIVWGALAGALLLGAGTVYFFAEQNTTREVAAPASRDQAPAGTTVATAPRAADQSATLRPAALASPQQPAVPASPAAGAPAPQAPAVSPAVTAQNSSSPPRDQSQGVSNPPAPSRAPSSAARPSMNQEPVALPNPDVMVVQASRAHMRSGPSRNARLVGTSVRGTEVKIVGRSGRWVKIETEGRSGWISGKLLASR